ncbi:MAG: LemA family protein [candidate division Zixibacteria bacterium]|jgi:LemA protein|nr:LemA family protein [candidate division Zixibacteria bacterium]
MLVLILFLLVVFGVPIFIIAAIYNGLVGSRNNVDAAYSQIDVLLTKRADLIPRLVETVKGYAAHEKGVLENVTASRSALLNAGGAAEKFAADNAITGALKSLFAVAENYPNLKADQNFRELQSQLSQVESELMQMRTHYNETVRNYNTKQQMFPANLFAAAFGHSPRQFYEAGAEKKEPPEVSFS